MNDPALTGNRDINLSDMILMFPHEHSSIESQTGQTVPQGKLLSKNSIKFLLLAMWLLFSKTLLFLGFPSL